MLGLSGHLGLPAGNTPPLLNSLTAENMIGLSGFSTGGLNNSKNSGNQSALPGLSGVADITASTGALDASKLMSSSTLGVMNMVNDSMSKAMSIFKGAQSWIANAPTISATSIADGITPSGADDGAEEAAGVSSGEATGLRAKIIEKAQSMLGLHQSNGRIRNFIKSLNPTSLPWCAAFVSQIVENVTGKLPWSGTNRNHVMSITRWAKNNNRFIPKTGQPQVGDAILMTRGRAGSDSGHIGIVTKINRDSSGKVTSVETIDGNVSNRVGKRTYNMSESRILGFLKTA